MSELLKVSTLATQFKAESGLVKAVDGISYHMDEQVPNTLNPPTGCNFHPRCFMAMPECSQVTPQLRDVGEGHEVACIRV